MKSFILSALVCCSMFAHGQAVFSHTKSNPTGAVVNTGADTSSAQLGGLYETLLISPVVTKVSGTVAGKAILQVSINGGAGTWSSPTGDTLTLADQAVNFANFKLPKDPFLFYRVITTGTGTMSATVTVPYVGKKNYQ